MPRYDQYQIRDVSNEHEHEYHYGDHGNDGNTATSDRRAAQGGDDVQAIAHRRVNRAYRKADHHHDAEMNEVDAQRLHDGDKDGAEDDQRRRHLEDAASQEHRQIDQQQYQPRLVRNAEQILGDRLRNLLMGEKKADKSGRRNQEHDFSADQAGPVQELRYL